MKKNGNILVTTSSFAEESSYLLEKIEEKGLEIVPNLFKRRLKEEELITLLMKHAPVGLLAGTETIGRKTLESSQKFLRVISRVGVGWDNVDRDAAEQFGIKVYRTPGVLTQAVAELTIGLIIACLRSIPLSDRMLRQGQWKKHMGSLLYGKVVGIIGFGNIGKRVGELLNAFGAKILYYDIESVEGLSWAKAVSLTELISESDIITIHASGNETIIGKEEFKMIGKQKVILINTARGGLIDETELYKSIVNNQVVSACLDVFAEEPYNGPLRTLEKVILTPHIGSYAREARQLMEEDAVENLLKGLYEVGVL